MTTAITMIMMHSNFYKEVYHSSVCVFTGNKAEVNIKMDKTRKLDGNASKVC